MLGAFGKFTLLDKIAVGGMAEVFRASLRDQSGKNRIVAIKRLHRSLCDDLDLVDMLVDEARLTVQLDHPSIGRVFDLGVYDQQSFIIMEFIDGPDLQFLTEQYKNRSQRFPVGPALYILKDVLDALHYAHIRLGKDGQPMHVVHRDVSPHNIMVDVKGVVRIVDFGIAKARDRIVQTQHGIIKGKYFYMSPEQAMSHHVDARSDVFSAGMVLYELLAGESPYHHLPDLKLLKAVRRAEFPPLSKYRPDLPLALVDVISRATKRDPERRYNSAADFQHALLAVMERLQIHVSAQDMSNLVLSFVRPTLHPSDATMQRDLYIASNESVIFHFPEENQNSGDPVLSNTQQNKSHVAPHALNGAQKNKKVALASLLDKKMQSRLIKGMLIFAALLMLLSFAVMFLKRESSINPREVEIEGPVVKQPLQIIDGDPESSKVRKRVAVAFQSTPSNAALTIDGKERGTTPLSLELAFPKEYKIKFVKDGFNSIEQTFYVNGTKSEVLVEFRKKEFVLRILSYPSNATITIEGKKRGKTPLTLSGFSKEQKIEVVATLNKYKGKKTVSWGKNDGKIQELMFEFKSSSQIEEIDPLKIKKFKKRTRRKKSRRKAQRKKKKASTEDWWGGKKTKKKKVDDGW